jgi:hypothetical protein
MEKEVISKGKLYYPATNRYGNGLQVMCDVCSERGISCCIGYEGLDICLPCCKYIVDTDTEFIPNVTCAKCKSDVGAHFRLDLTSECTVSLCLKCVWYAIDQSEEHAKMVCRKCNFGSRTVTYFAEDNLCIFCKNTPIAVSYAEPYGVRVSDRPSDEVVTICSRYIMPRYKYQEAGLTHLAEYKGISTVARLSNTAMKVEVYDIM